MLVHGVPETAHVWEPLVARLGRSDVVTLSLPGFGCPRPAGFAATKEAYVGWLVDALRRIEGPIDLVGHDWGGGFVLRAVSQRADLVRTWVTDVAGMGDPGFRWHDNARVWQTPGEGEQFWDAILAAPPEMRAMAMEAAGVPAPHALAMVEWIDRTMADCILALYRSAVHVGEEWSPGFVAIPRPGLVLVPKDDAFLDHESARRGTARAGATLRELDGLGHWWLLQDPARAAGVLREFWDGVR